MGGYYDYHPTHQLHRPLALVGFVNAVTRKVAHELSSISGLPAIHIDDLVQHELGASSHSIILQHGLKGWRVAENRVLGAAISSSPPAIISLGEGSVEQFDDIHLVLDRAQLIYLHLSLEEAATLASRQNAVQGASLWTEIEMRGGSWDDEIRSLFEERAFNYRMAHHVIDLSSGNVRAAAKQILEMIPSSETEPALIS
jgi:shikimate kinase